MPKTIENYKANALRDQELTLEQKAEISILKCSENDLRQKLASRDVTIAILQQALNKGKS